MKNSRGSQKSKNRKISVKKKISKSDMQIIQQNRKIANCTLCQEKNLVDNSSSTTKQNENVKTILDKIFIQSSGENKLELDFLSIKTVNKIKKSSSTSFFCSKCKILLTTLDVEYESYLKQKAKYENLRGQVINLFKNLKEVQDDNDYESDNVVFLDPSQIKVKIEEEFASEDENNILIQNSSAAAINNVKINKTDNEVNVNFGDEDDGGGGGSDFNSPSPALSFQENYDDGEDEYRPKSKTRKKEKMSTSKTRIEKRKNLKSKSVKKNVKKIEDKKPQIENTSKEESDTDFSEDEPEGLKKKESSEKEELSPIEDDDENSESEANSSDYEPDLKDAKERSELLPILYSNSSSRSRSRRSTRNTPMGIEIESEAKEKEYKCISCPLIFTGSDSSVSKELINHHQVTGCQKFPCSVPDCTLELADLDLFYHLQDDHSLTQVKCPRCQNNWKTPLNSKKSSLQNHLWQHYTGRFFCTKADCSYKKGFDTEIELKKHESKHEMIKCKKCYYFYANELELKTHLQIHDKNRTEFICYENECDCTFDNYKSLSNHHKSAHKDYTQKTTNNNNKFICAYCPESPEHEDFNTEFDTKKERNKHYAEKHPEIMIFNCDECPNKYRTPGELGVHLKICHIKEKTFICQYCAKDFKFRKYLDRHIEQMHSKNPIFENCSICNVKIYRVHMKKHLKHHTEDKLACSICGKLFIKSRLNRHILEVHKTEEDRLTFECNKCEKVFGRKDNLKNHIKNIHDKIKPYKCLYLHCNREFSLKKNFEVHCTLHSGIKPFNCDLCNKNYSHENYLALHYKDAHSIKISVPELRKKFKMKKEVQV